MSRAKGDLAEEKASLYLCDNGYQIVERNFYSRFGEIDIIASKDSILHFVEVKSGLDYESAILNITKSKLNKLIKTINVYLKKNNPDAVYVLDAIVVTQSDIVFVENITI
jgi:putative endonuclease